MRCTRAAPNRSSHRRSPSNRRTIRTPGHHAIDDLASYAWIVFSSQNAVEAFFDRLNSLDADARYIGRTKVAAIGTRTAQRLREYGVRADLVPAEFVSEELAPALIDAAKTGDRVLVYRAQDARDVLPQMLEDAGLRVTVVDAYKTSFVRDPDSRRKSHAPTC